MRSICLLILISTGFVFAGGSESKADPAAILDVFVGEWQGTATAWFPRLDDREPRRESVEATCSKTLKGTYAEFRSTWTQPDGKSRDLIIFWNYDARRDSFQILFLYDNWPGKVQYALHYDSLKRLFKGYDTFTGRDGVPAQERVEWRISEDGNTIYGREFNHYQTDPEGYWPQTFEFVWQRKAENDNH